MSTQRFVFAFSFAACLAIAGCVTTTPPHNLSPESVRALRFERLDLVVNPGANINWPAAVEEWTKSSTATPAAPRASRETATEGLQAHVAAQLRARARNALEPQLKTALAGGRPVIARMTVNHIHVPTFMEGVAPALIWGPQAVQSGLRANIDILDARTSAVVLSFPDTLVTTQGGYNWTSARPAPSRTIRSSG